MRKLIGRGLLWFIGPALLEQWSREMDEINATLRERAEPVSPERISALTAAAVEVRQSLIRRFMAENVPVRGRVH